MHDLPFGHSLCRLTSICCSLPRIPPPLVPQPRGLHYIRIEDFNGGGWLVGPDLGDPTAFLRNISKSAAVPTSGWQYWQYSYGGGCWWPAPADLTATLLPDLSTILCANVTVSAYLLSFSPQPGYSGAAARCSRPPPAGCYRPVIVAAGSCAMVRVRRGC